MSQADSLKSQVEALDNEEAGAVCQLAHLDKREGASAKQKRILSFLEGPPARQRPGWLQFFLFVRSQGVVGDDGELDYAPLGEENQTLLSDFVDSFHVDGKFLRAPRFSILPDLRVTSRDSQDDQFEFDKSWPSQAAVQEQLGNTSPPSSSGSSDAGHGVSEAEIRANILADIGEGRLGEDSAAVIRRTHAFAINSDVFFLFDHMVDRDSQRKYICDGKPLSCFSRTKMAELLFENQLTATDTKRIQRRYLVPEEFYSSAPSIEDPAAISEMGGRKGKYFKEFERLRVKQEAILSKHQSLFFLLSKSSEVFLKAELQSVGVDVKKFQAHIIRSSSMKLAIGGGKPEDQVLRTAQVSQKVFSDFYNLPLVDATTEPENMLGAAAADCLMDASVPELTGTNAQTNMGEAERGNASARGYSPIESLGAINDS